MNREADRRKTRARQLAAAVPAASDPLTFYADLVELQQSILDAHADAVIRSSETFAESLDAEAAADVLPAFLTRLAGIAPSPTASAAQAVLLEGHDRWRHLLHACWNGEPDDDPMRGFIAEAVLQPFAVVAARRVGLRPDPPYADGPSMNGPVGRVPPQADPPRCPICGDQPVVAVLREAAHGAKRTYVCGFCLAEQPAPRIGCAACGEASFEKLAVYRADEIAAARIDACDTCRTYLKTIDLTKDGNAVPVVDDIATVTLDVWAREQGYRRLRQNLLRL
jgi:formate dehydrogenase maturation protein FdhE